MRDRAIGANPNAIEIFYKDGTQSLRAEVEFPIGHPRRRAEGVPLLVKKFETNSPGVLRPRASAKYCDLCLNHERLAATAVNTFTDLLAA